MNYRSTGHILGAASGLVARNRARLGKTLWTEGEAGARVRIASLWDDEEEARFVGEEIEAEQRDGRALNDIAVLVRAGFQTRAFEERFVDLGLPYRVIGGPRFYERAEIRDAIAYVRIVHQPDDDLALERIINVPKRGLGEATLQLLRRTARDAGISLCRGRAGAERHRRAAAAGAHRHPPSPGQLRALARAGDARIAARGGRDGAGGIRLRAHVAGGPRA